MKIIAYPVSSVLPSESFAAPGVIRAERGANPVNASNAGHRETQPLNANATGRVKHPRLNKQSWVTEYAQARTEPRMARTKAKAKYSRRTRKSR